MDASFHQLDDTKARALHLLTCPLCTKQYEDPRLLPCQHTFCCRCLLSHVDRVQSSRQGSARLGAFPCPICFAGVGLPSAGVSAFPVDQRIRNIRDLVVQEMAKDLASRFSRQPSDDGGTKSADDVSSRHRGAGVSSSTRLDDIREQTGSTGDDDVDSGTWSSSSRRQFTEERSTPMWSYNEPVFSRQKLGYSSLRGAKSSRRSRPTVADKFQTPPDITSTVGGGTPDGTTESGFSRNMPGYYSLRDSKSKLRRGRAGDVGNAQQTSDSPRRSDGPSVRPSNSFTNGYPSSPQSPEPARNGFQRTSSNAEVTSKSSPFDNINRDDDLYSQPYTPKIGRNRLAYSSLRERRRRPLFDYNRFSDDPADLVDEETSSAFDSGNHEDRASSERHFHSNFRSQYESHPTTLQQDDDQLHEGDQVGTGIRSRTRERRQRPASLDPSSLSVLSHFVSSMNVRTDHDRASESSRDQNHSPSYRNVDYEGDRCTNESQGKHASYCPVRDEVTSVSESQEVVTSQSNGFCHTETSERDAVASNGRTETTSSAHISQDRTNGGASQCSPDMSKFTAASPSADMVEQRDLGVRVSSSSPEAEAHSPVRSPNASHFSRLTKFRTSKNSRSSPPSTSPGSSESPTRDATGADTAEAPVAKPRYRKRPPIFVGTPFTFNATSSDQKTSPNVDKEEVHDAVHEVCCDHVTEDKDQRGQTASSPTTDMAADTQSHTETYSSDVSPTTETSSGTELHPNFETHDQSTAVNGHRSRVERTQDDDSAVYSADMDSDATVRSGIEQYLQTPVTDDDEDNDEQLRSGSDAGSSTSPGMVEDRPDDVIRCRLDDDDGDHRPTSAVAEPVKTGASEDADRSSTSSEPDDRHQQNDGHAQSDGDEENACRVEGKDADVHDGHRQSSVTCDDVTDTSTSRPSLGYVLATGVTALSDGSLVVADYGAGCVCISDGGQSEHRVTGLKPFSIATSPSTGVISHDDEQLIYVGDRRRKTLLVLDRHGADVAQWPDNQFDWICGIACLPDGQLAVLDRSRTRQLVVYSSTGGNGGEVRPVAELGGHGSALGDLCMAEFVAADSRGRLLVADSCNHCVKAFDPRVAAPGVVAVYGTKRGSGEAQLEWPKGVAVDASDNVLVADCRNSRVVAFSVDGRALGAVVPAVRGPYAVCALPTSRLAVTTYSICGLSDFAVYEYDSTQLLV